MPDLPDDDQLSRYFAMIGRKGGKARLSKMTAEQRRKAIATKASKAAAKARTKKAQERAKQPVKGSKVVANRKPPKTGTAST